MTRYMLDTNTVSHLIKGQLTVARRVVAVPMASLCISSITAGELLFGLAKRPDAKRLHAVVKEFLRCLDVAALGWRHGGALRDHPGRDGAAREDTRTARSADRGACLGHGRRAGDE